jgi:flagellar hook-associated protein 1 FlgK
MINSFQPLNTITSGLILQQLEQEVNANNLSQTSLDSQGYLMNSLEQVNSVSNPSISFTGLNGPLSIGTGSSAESITRLRSSFLDSQIQQQSTTVGYNEVLSNSTSTGIMDQINSILNGTTTLTSSLNGFKAAWAALSTTSASSAGFSAAQQAVVTAGESFASTASSQFDQLQNLQLTSNNQINQTVSQINGLLQQLASINGQLLQTGGSNQNSLLDARDYALDKLSRLVNVQTNYGANGTVNVWLSDVALVNGTSASALQTSAENVNNPQFVDITVSGNGGIFSSKNGSVTTATDITSEITGGNLGGEIYGRNVLLQNYKVQVDQLAASVINITNGIYSAGYVANGGVPGVTGNNFFSGNGASNIAVNGALQSAPTTLATEIQATSTPASLPATPLPSGELAKILSNLPSLLANNFMTSQSTVGTPPVDPTATLLSQALDVTPGTSSFTLNGVTISYTETNSINDILNEINTNVTGVYAVFNTVSSEFNFYSANPITYVAGAGDGFTWASLQNAMIGSFDMNNVSAPNPKALIDIYSALDASTSIYRAPSTYGPNTQGFLVTPGASGSFTVSYVNGLGVPTNTVVQWNNSQTLDQILSALPLGSIYLKNEQSFEIFSSSPFQIVDNSGNFTAFTGLNGNLSIASMASNVSSNASAQDTALQATYTSSSASLTQLNNAQANIAGVSTSSSVPGVPIATIQEEAQQSLITYNAMLQVMEVINQMLDALVGVSTTSSSSGIFATRNS